MELEFVFVQYDIKKINKETRKVTINRKVVENRLPALITYPKTDEFVERIIALLKEIQREREKDQIITRIDENLGTTNLYGLLSSAGTAI